MPVSNVSIANRALTWISDKQITSFSENSNAARTVNDVFDMCRDGLVGDYPWTFALKRALLAASVDVPAWGWTHSFPMPAEAMRMWEIADWWAVNDANTGWGWINTSSIDSGGIPAGYNPQSYMPYQLEGRAILANGAGPLPVRYVQYVTDPTQFPPAFIDALTAKLAAEIGPRVTGSMSVVDTMMAKYKDAVARAKRANAIVQPKVALRDGLWTTQRFRGP